MKALVQRVSHAVVSVDGVETGRIRRGILVLLGVDKGDTEAAVTRLLERVLGYRIFPDSDGHLNCSLQDTGGDLLVVSQFTLSANTRKGMRPSVSSAAPPEVARTLYESFVRQAEDMVDCVETGRFGADMSVELVNDGPVTFLLEV